MKKLIRKPDIKPIIIYFVGLFGLIVLMSFIFTILGLNDDFANLFQIFCEGLVFLLFIFMYRKYLKFDFKRLTKKDWIFVIIASIIIIVSNDLLSRLFEYLKIESNNQNIVVNLFNNYPFLSFFFIVLFGPVVEEFVFRYSLGTLIKNEWLFLIVSSLAFGIIHGVGVITILYVLMGFGFGYIYLRTNRNIVSSSFAHILNNLVSVIMMMFGI